MGSNCTKKRFDEKDVETAKQFIQTGDECYKRRSFVNAINYYQKALEIESVLKRQDRLSLIKHYRSLSSSFQGLEDYEQALIYENKARRLASKNKKKYIQILLNIYKTLALLYEELGESKDAYRYYQKRVNEAKSYLGKRNIEYEKALLEFAIFNQGYKGEKEALKQFSLFLKNMKNTQGDNHPLSAECFKHLGAIMKEQGKYSMAFKFYWKSKTIYEETLGRRDLDLAGVYYNMAIIQKDQLEFEGSWTSLKKCLEIQIDFFEENCYELEETVKLMLYIAKILPEARKEILERIDWLERRLTSRAWRRSSSTTGSSYSYSRRSSSPPKRTTTTILLDFERIKQSLFWNPREIQEKEFFDDEDCLTEERTSSPIKLMSYRVAASIDTECSFLTTGDVKISLLNNPH